MYVDGIPPSVSEGELEALFAACGPVLSVQLATTAEGRSLGVARIRMDRQEHVEAALQAMHHFQLHGSFLLVYRDPDLIWAHNSRDPEQYGTT